MVSTVTQLSGLLSYKEGVVTSRVEQDTVTSDQSVVSPKRGGSEEGTRWRGGEVTSVTVATSKESI